MLITDDEGEEEWVKLSLKERKPFLDDEDKPIEASSEPSEEADASEEDSSSESTPNKRKRKTTKAAN